MAKRIVHGVQDYAVRHQFPLEWPVNEMKKEERRKSGAALRSEAVM
jgi:hypothetical protein